MPTEELSKQEMSQEQVAAQNAQILQANRDRAVAWIRDNKGIGICLGMDPDGAYHTWIVGSAQKLMEHEPKLDSQLFNMLLLLIGSHLPGASAASHAMHMDSAQRLEIVDQKLGALLNNLGVLVSFLQLKFPELRVQPTRMGSVKSGLIVPP